MIVAEADPASIPLEDREDLHVKPDPDAMANGHTNGLDIKVYPICLPLTSTQLTPTLAACALLLTIVAMVDCQAKTKGSVDIKAGCNAPHYTLSMHYTLSKLLSSCVDIYHSCSFNMLPFSTVYMVHCEAAAVTGA